MKICVLISSPDQLKQAGVRIRYRRIERDLKRAGSQIRVIPIQDLVGIQLNSHDVYIISKCHDARAHMAAQILRRSRKLVGVDLFDDYFSQIEDSRFTRLRIWLDSLLGTIDFILCSTPEMSNLARHYAPQLPVHVMNDPTSPLDPAAICSAINNKLEYTHKTGRMEIAWFGMGDNPYFPVGLQDLVAYGYELANLRRSGFDVWVNILTNQRALTTDTLVMLKRLAVPYTLDEWTELKETALLEKSVACFLPVNAQNFSIAKSLNRAVSALSTGTQVLATGYPLYEPLLPFIYNNAAQLVTDIEERRPILREGTVPEFIALMKQLADPSEETGKLLEFLETLAVGRDTLSQTNAGMDIPLCAIIHGKETTSYAHKFAKKVGILSVASPYCLHKLNYDVRFIYDRSHGMELYVSEALFLLLRPELQAKFVPAGKIIDTVYQKLNTATLETDIVWNGSAMLLVDSPMTFTASSINIMQDIISMLQTLFPGICCYPSEQSKLPWRFENSASRHAIGDS